MGYFIHVLYEFGKHSKYLSLLESQKPKMAQKGKKCSTKGQKITYHTLSKKSKKKIIRNVKIYFGGTGENYESL